MTRSLLTFVCLLLSLFPCRIAPAQSSPVFSRTFDVARDGEIHLRLTARANGCRWDKAGAESAVVTLTLDGNPNQDVVLYGGDKPTGYDVSLGRLVAGKHTLAVLFRRDLSPAGATGVVVDDARFNPRGNSAALNEISLVWKHAPRLYGRDDNMTSDVPLVLYYETHDKGDTLEIVYTIIWSNEDGGTGNDLGSLIARWGRTTDIEWMYIVTLKKVHSYDTRRKRDLISYLTESARYQGPGHQTLPFAGAYRDNHPLLYTVTTNNMVSDKPRQPVEGEPMVKRAPPLLFALAPMRKFDSTKATRETEMDALPDAHRIAALEMQREGKIESPADPQTPTLSDLRNYLNVDYRAECGAGALLYVEVRHKNGSQYVSHHGRIGDAIGRSGWVRTTVELPPGTRPADIVSITFRRADTTNASASVTAVRAFLLDANYRPQKPFFTQEKTLTVATSQ